MSGRGPLDDPTPLPETYQGAAPPLRLPNLAGPERADIAVIGGGFTGLSAALHLARASCAVVVLEAREIGWGGSGRAFGQVVPYAKHDSAHVLATFGPDWGERLITGLAGGPDLVFCLIAGHGMDCEAIRAGLIFAAHTRAAQAGLEQRATIEQRRGADVSMLYGDTLAAVTGTRFYGAALLDRRGGCINPLAYARDLARAVLSAGGRVFEDSPAVDLRRGAAGWQIRTSIGELLADQVILATDAYTGDLWQGLGRSIVSLRGYQVVSQPLSDTLRHTILPGGQAITDSRRLYSGIRLRADGRLHVSVDGPAFSNRGAGRTVLATKRVQSLFPHLPPLVWDHAVAGWVGMTADHYPHIHRLAPGLIAAIGLSGRGIAFGTLLGRDVSLRVLGRPETEWMMPDTPVRPVWAKGMARLLVGGLMSYYRALDAVDLQRGCWTGYL